MAVDETLQAVFNAENGVSPELRDISEDAVDAASSLDVMATAADIAEGALDSLERAGASAVPTLEATEAQIEAVGDTALVEAGKVEALDQSLSDLDTSGVAQNAALGGDVARSDGGDPTLGGASPVTIQAEVDDASFLAARDTVDHFPDRKVVDIVANTDEASFAAAQASMAGLPDDTEASIGVDGPGSVAAPAMPDTSSLDFADQSVKIDVEGVDGLSEAAAAGHVYAEGMDAARDSALRAATSSALAASRTDEAGQSMMTTAANALGLSGAYASLRNAATGVALGMGRAEGAIDETGDEAAASAAQIGTLSTSMAGLGAGGLGTEFLGFHGSVTSLITVLPLLISLLGGMVGPLAAITAGAGGAGGALMGMLGAGLLGQAEQMVGQLRMVDGELKRIEDSGEAIEVIFGDIKDRASEILAPLKTAQTASLFQGLVGSGLATLQDAVAMTTSVMGPLLATSDRLGDAFAVERPEFFAELRALIIRTLPALESFATWALGAVPDGLRWMRTEGMETAAVFATLGGKALSAAVELAELGGTIWSVVGPPLSFLLSVGTGVLDFFNSLPEPIQTAAVAAAVAYPALIALSGALATVSAAGGVTAVVMGAVSWPILAVAAAIGVVVAVATNMDAIVSALATTWNGFLDIIQGFYNFLVGSFIGGINWVLDKVRALADLISMIPGIDIDTSGLKNLEHNKADFGGFKLDEGGGGGGGGGPPSPPGPQQPPGPGPASGGGYGSGGGGTAAASSSSSGSSGDNHYHYHNHDEGTNEARAKRVARDVFNDMREGDRKSQSKLN